MSVVNEKKYGVVRVMLLLAVSATVRSAMAQATIHQMQGAVDVRAMGTAQWVAAVQGSALSSGSLIRTEAGAAVVALPDGTSVALWPQTTLDFRQIEFKSDTKALTLNAVLWQGQLQFKFSTSASSESSYVVKTPNAEVTPVRADGNVWYAKATGTRVSVLTGQASVSAMKKSVALTASQETTVPPGAAPRAPQMMGVTAPMPAPPPQPTPPTSTQPPVRTTPPASASEAQKRKAMLKERLLGVTTIVAEELLSPERLDLQIEELERHISREPNDIAAHSRLAALYTQRKRPSAGGRPSDIDFAVQHYKIVAQAEQGKAESHLHLGEAYARSGDADNAIQELQHVLRLNPRSAGAYQWLAIIHAAQEHHDEAERAYKRAIELEPLNPLLHWNYGRFLSYRGRAPEAIAQVEESIKLAGEGRFAILIGQFKAGLAFLYLQNKQIDEAIGLMSSLAQAAPRSVAADLHFFLGLMYLEKGQEDNALKAFQDGSVAHPNNPLLHYGMAGLYQKQGNKAKAADELELFLNSIPPSLQLPPGFPTIADIRDHMRILRGQEPLQKDRGVKKDAT
jgi:Tfp pilus assembly protein PilF